jgi:hypothetical protein
MPMVFPILCLVRTPISKMVLLSASTTISWRWDLLSLLMRRCRSNIGMRGSLRSLSLSITPPPRSYPMPPLYNDFLAPLQIIQSFACSDVPIGQICAHTIVTNSSFVPLDAFSLATIICIRVSNALIPLKGTYISPGMSFLMSWSFLLLPCIPPLALIITSMFFWFLGMMLLLIQVIVLCFLCCLFVIILCRCSQENPMQSL